MHKPQPSLVWPAAAPLPAAAQPVLPMEDDFGVVPSWAPPPPTSNAAPRRSLSLSAINSSPAAATGNNSATLITVQQLAAARPPLLFRGLSAANLVLDEHQQHQQQRHRRTSSDGGSSDDMQLASPHTGGGDSADGSAASSSMGGFFRLPHVLAATAVGATAPSLAAQAVAQSSLYRMSSASDASLPEEEEAMMSVSTTAAGTSAEPSAEQLAVALRQHQPGTLDTLLSALWEDCAARGLFRYDVASCATRVLRGARWRWVAQLNEGRATKKRPTELKIDAVLQPFDAVRFHFGKAAVREALLQFHPLGNSSSSSAAGVQQQQQQRAVAAGEGAWLVESSAVPSDPTLVLINVSPIEFGHVLLVPRVLAQRPQRLGDAGVLGEALAFAREVGNPAFRVGYNSLGAYASINHLHFQGYYLHEPFPCELAAVTPLTASPSTPLAALAHFERAFPRVAVGTLEDYPVRGWVVEQRALAGQEGGDGGEAERQMAEVLARLTAGLEQLDQPYNVFVVDCGRKAFVWPQCFAERQAAGQVPEDVLETGVNPAAFEIAGHLLLKRQEDFDRVTDASAQRMLAQASLPARRFEWLTRTCLLLLAE